MFIFSVNYNHFLLRRSARSVRSKICFSRSLVNWMSPLATFISCHFQSSAQRLPVKKSSVTQPLSQWPRLRRTLRENTLNVTTHPTCHHWRWMFSSLSKNKNTITVCYMTVCSSKVWKGAQFTLNTTDFCFIRFWNIVKPSGETEGGNTFDAPSTCRISFFSFARPEQEAQKTQYWYFQCMTARLKL